MIGSTHRTYDEATPVLEAAVREFAGALEPDDIAHLVHARGVMRAALKASD